MGSSGRFVGGVNMQLLTAQRDDDTMCERAKSHNISFNLQHASLSAPLSRGNFISLRQFLKDNKNPSLTREQIMVIQKRKTSLKISLLYGLITNVN